MICRQAQLSGLSYIDATSLAVCYPKRICRNKVFAGVAALGKITKGWFFGLELHLLINEKGKIQVLKLTPGKEGGLHTEQFQQLPNILQDYCLGNKGYIKQELFDELYSKEMKLITEIKKKMKNKLMPLFEKILLRKRSIIETVFSVLKGSFEREYSRHRSIWNALVHILSTLVACYMKPTTLAISKHYLIQN